MIDAGKFRRNEGWLWHFRHSGRVIGHREGSAIVQLLERTLALAYEMDAEKIDHYRRLWDPLLANGPRLL